MKPTFKLWQGFLASGAIHAALVLPFFVTLPVTPKKPHTLVVEFKGQISNRQTEQRVTAPTPAEPPRPTPPPERKTEQPPKEVKKQPAIKARPPEPQQPQPPQPPQPAARTADTQQPQQTIRVTDDEKQREQDYANALTRLLKKNLVYPQAAKESGLWGTTTIQFVVTVSGDLREGSLVVVKSSGFPELDRQALSTVRTLAPYSPPPTELTIVTRMSFDMGN